MPYWPPQPEIVYGRHGLAFAVAFFLPFIGGIALDVLLHTFPFFLTIGLIAAVSAVLIVLFVYRNDISDANRP